MLQGYTFHWDPSTVRINHCPEGGEVKFEGIWDGTGERYNMVMRPRTSSRAGNGSSKTGTQLQVAAQHVPRAGASTGPEQLQGALPRTVKC